MPIITDWGNVEETLLVLKFGNEWTAKEFVQAARQTDTLLRQKSYRVNIICDLRRTGFNAPPNLLTLAKGALRDGASNVGNIVMLSQSRFWRMMIEVLQGTGVARDVCFFFTADVDEAYQLAENGDVALKNAANNSP
jgi:hypothetical protein